MFFNDFSLEEALYRIPVVIIAFTLHEFMHAYTADRFGDPTPRSNGRLTLNPMVHIDWIGFILILIAGFGWAKPVPTIPRNYTNYKKGRIMVSLAGPLTNLVLAFIGLFILHFSHSAISQSFILLKFLNVFVSINVVLFAFNLLPVPPLDGATLVEMALSPRAMETYRKIKNYGIMILIGLSFLGILSYYFNFVYFIFIKLSNWIFYGLDYIIGLL
ncbi:MAG: site-2 protease family protein [Clostridia bacterium]|nr:site-2 protease family protein [Clostridia bacterium]